MAERELSSPPSLTALYPRAVAGSTVLPVLRQLPLVGGRFRGGGSLPDEELVLPDAAIERERLNAYSRVCGFRVGDELPATYPHLLAFPLGMQLMTAPSFPFPAMGLVHIINRIELLRPIAVSETLTFRVRADGLAPHDRGTQFEIRAEASAGGEPVWRGVSTYLHREGGGGSGGGRERGDDAPPPQPAAVWEVPGDIGRRYGGVSGDRNPIHMHPLSARLFGLPKAIAHGMWLKARCLAALEGHLPEAYSVEVRFKLPLFIPGRVGFSSWEEGGTREFRVDDARSGKPHLEGRVERGG